MTDQEDKFNLGKIVFDDSKQERKSWACLEQTCSRYLVVSLTQLFRISLIFFGCFWKIRFLKTGDESTDQMGNLCSEAGYILPSPGI